MYRWQLAILQAVSVGSGMTSVYTFGPTFRAEKSHSRRHLAEFYMVEAETVTLGDAEAGLMALMELVEDLVISITRAVGESCEEEIKLISEHAEDSKV